MVGKRRIAICGFNLESNRFAPTCNETDFKESMYFSGPDISKEARAEYPKIHLGVKGFFDVMDKKFDGEKGWDDEPILVIGSSPAGPVEENFFNKFLEELETRLKKMGQVDGVYICQHGAAVATHTHDPDGEMFKLVRRIVGPKVPIVGTLDLHANISQQMVDETDLLIGYRTNPHVDLFERGQEAAHCMLELFSGIKLYKHWIKLPLVAPSVTLLTDDGHPYGDLIREGQRYIGGDIINVTILAGFAFSDTPKNGMSFLVYSRESSKNAEMVTQKLAQKAWVERERYKTNMISLSKATKLAKEVGDNPLLEPLLFADPADNPGGGGRGNTTFILKEFLEAGVTNCVVSVFFDLYAVQAAFEAGVGSKINITLNDREKNQFSELLTIEATVLSLHSGKFEGKYGMVAGTTADTGKTAVLQVEGIQLICISKRQQCRSSDFISAFGINPTNCRTIVVKSRGHFRAGFKHIFNPNQILEIDVPGLTSPNLSCFDWKYLPRPVYPLDRDTIWQIDN